MFCNFVFGQNSEQFWFGSARLGDLPQILGAVLGDPRQILGAEMSKHIVFPIASSPSVLGDPRQIFGAAIGDPRQIL